ncbi:LuxR C-terminal-related transcriptional regulator [Paraburkholderia sp. BCC1886]|uniref:LuxR C-terminal-related transcriptional regulator n=1 Tax=Paraburkholderia sp. BCC1886 TaxID=2562670 RepID=UPI0011836A02|nr:LuxR C-terminal-related transcriptional regulator [Paraburkholderia sp. BCC1886]
MSQNVCLARPHQSQTPAAPEAGPNPRCVAPRGNTRAVPRERLLAQLLDARRKRCIVIQGPAGCGKTNLAIAWREALLALGFDVAWLSLAAEDDDPTRFLADLTASLAPLGPAVCQQARLAHQDDADEAAIQRNLIALTRGIGRHPNDVVLVLDDLHHVGHPGQHASLQWLLDFAPPNLHLVLVSRSTLPLSLGRPRDQGLLLELGARDLRFSAAESESLLRAQLGDVDRRDARRLHERADGWVTGLQRLAAQLKKRKVTHDRPASAQALASALLYGAQDACDFADFFEHAVLSRLTPAELELLIRMASCTRLCASLCIALKSASHTSADVHALLTRLERDNLFLMPLDKSAEPRWYRLNPLLRETLLVRFRARGEWQQRAVHLAAWRWWRDHDQADEAVRHALLAGEPGAAAELVQRVARTLQLGGDVRKLIALIRLLPVAEVDARIDLRLWRIHLQLYARDFDACAAELARLDTDLPSADSHAHHRLILLRAALAVQRDDCEAAVALLPLLQRIPTHADPLVVGGRNNLMSWIHMRIGEYETARQVQSDAPQRLADGAPLMGTSSGLLNGRCMTGFGHALEGNFIAAERIGRDVLFDATRFGRAASEAMCFATALLGEVLYETGDPEGARVLLEEQVDLLERVSIPDSVLRVFVVLAGAHWLAGDPSQAFACLDRLDGHAARHGLPRLAAHSLAEQIRYRLQTGQFELAETGLARLRDLAARFASAAPGNGAEIHAVAGRALLDASMARNDFAGALQRLHALIPFCEAHGWQREVVRLQLVAARIEACHGHTDAAHRIVLAALRRAQRLGLVRSLLDADSDTLPLIVEAVQHAPHDPVLAFHVERLHAARAAEATQPARRASAGASVGSELLPPYSSAGGLRHLATLGAEPLSEREARVIRLLAQALPNKKIARTLGISPETVKWHLKNIYGKLGVATRDEAVARVRDLELGTEPGVGMAALIA